MTKGIQVKGDEADRFGHADRELSASSPPHSGRRPGGGLVSEKLSVKDDCCATVCGSSFVNCLETSEMNVATSWVYSRSPGIVPLIEYNALEAASIVGLLQPVIGILDDGSFADIARRIVGGIAVNMVDDRRHVRQIQTIAQGKNNPMGKYLSPTQVDIPA